MTMNRVFGKLRKYNKENYRQLIFCISFAILLITSFGSTMFSPTIQNALDDGGDSRKIVAMIFAISILGCLMFSIYTVGLFFKYKSKETGVFLALGTSKKVLSKALFTELLEILLQCTLVGILLGFITSFGIWQGFRLILMNNEHIKYQFSILGILSGLLFSLVIGIIVLVLAMRFMKRSNIMDILYDEQKSEPLDNVTKGYGLSGAILIVLGLFLGYIVPAIVGNIFKILLPAVWNLIFILVPIGMYRVIVYAISYNKRGRNPQKYYKKLISSSMMKFQGKQTVRNMLVISLLITASLFALSYPPMNGFSLLWANADNPTDFSLHYKLSMDEVTETDIYSLAESYDTEITSYDELIFSELIGSGVDRNFTEEGDFFENYSLKYLFSEFVSESEYNRVMKTSVSVPASQYILLLQPEAVERIWVKFNDLDLVTNPDTNETLSLSLFTTLENPSLARYESQRYILNDKDYEAITTGISSNNQTRQILFNVSDLENSFPFAKALFQLYLEKAPEELARMNHYDAYQHSLAIEEGREYGYATPIDLTWGSPGIMSDWKYYPRMKIIISKTLFQEFAVQFLLFIFVAIICLSSVGIIAYTRSISVGLSNKQFFEDLQKLGANKKYISKLIFSQLNKIFIIPTILGSILILAFGLLISLGNDGQFSPTELKIFVANLIITLIVWIYLYIVYSFSLKKVKNIVEVD